MEFFSFLSNHTNEVADFYAGMIKTTFDLDIRKDLQACMVRDSDLTKVWDMAIDDLDSGDDEAFDTHFQLALELSPHDLEACGKIPKVAIAGKQLEAWWEDFWVQGDADDKLVCNLEDNWGKVVLQVTTTQMDWELGYYYDAGKRFGKLSNILIGKPNWQEIAAEPTTVAPNGKALAIFDGATLAWLFDDDQTKTLESCII